MKTLNANQINLLGMVRGCTGRQVVDRSIVTTEARANMPVDLDGLLELGLLVCKSMRLDVGRGVKLSVPGLYLTAAGRRVEVNALTDADQIIRAQLRNLSAEDLGLTSSLEA